MATKTTKNDVVLGSGDLFILVDNDASMSGLTIGTKEFYDALEVDNNQIGHIKGGAALEYTSEWKKVKDDYKVTVKQFLTNEDVKLKSGLLAWNGETLTTLCATGREYPVDSDGIKLFKFGGTQNANNLSYFIHFRHKRSDGTIIRVTIIGVNENGFSLKFDPDNETVVDAEFNAQGNTDDSGTLVYYSEQDPVTTCLTPIAYPPAGAVSSGTDVVLFCGTTGATIYYTTDGSTPSTSSTEYTGSAISITSTTTIKAIAVKSTLANSAVMTATYTV